MNTSTKLGLWILTIAGITTAALWMIGGKEGEFSTELTINASPETVFPYLVEPDHLKNWNSGLVDVARYDAPPQEQTLGPPAIKKTNRTISIDGKQVQFDDQVIRFEENKLLSIQSTNSNAIRTAIFRLEPKGSVTQVTYRVKAVNCGFGRIMAPLQSDSTKLRIDNDILQLKELVEGTRATIQ